MAADVQFTLAPAWKRRGWPPGNTPETRAGLTRVGNAIVVTAQRLCPVDEGDLVTTIRSELGNDSVGPHVRILAGGMMGPNKFVDYAAHVEGGTSRMAAQPYLRPAVDQAVGLGRL